MTELTADNRRRLREEVEKRKYNIVWAGGEYPFAVTKLHFGE